MNTTDETTKWLRARDLMSRYGVSRQTIYAWRRRGILPAAVQLGPNTVAWDPRAIEQFEKSRLKTA